MTSTRNSRQGRQEGYILLVIPILLLGMSFLVFQSMSRSRVAMKISGAELGNLQVKMCAQQCASLAVNATTRAMEDGVRAYGGSKTCPCEGDPALPVSCVTTIHPPTQQNLANCYALEVARTEVDIHVQCRQGSDRAVKLEEGVFLQEIPIFQFAVFFDGVLEINNGPPMTLTGRVHSNDTVTLTPGSYLYLQDWVTSARLIQSGKKEGWIAPSWGIGFPKMDGTGSSTPLTFTNTTLRPLAEVISAWPEWQKSHRVAYALEGSACGPVERLSIPLKGLADEHGLIEWRSPDDSPEARRYKYAWRANLIYKDGRWMDNQLSPVTFGNPSGKPTRRPVLTDPTDTTRVTFWDNREKLMVRLLPMDVDLLQQRPGDTVIYIHDVLPDPAQGGRDAGGILLHTGSKLRRPLTVITNSRIYMWGDYNTDSSYVIGPGKKGPFPSSLVGDAYTQLSNQWNPIDYSFLQKWTKKIKEWKIDEVTILNACIMAGMPEKDGSWAGTGGYHNFIRFMEDWNNIPFAYSGSTVAVWSSRIAQGTSHDAWYSPPIRQWAFDPMYRDMRNMPPATPRVVSPKLNTWEIARD